MKIIFIILCLFITQSFAGEAKILALRGFISFNGKGVKKDTLIKSEGKIKTGAASYIKLKMNHLKSVIIIGPNSEMDLSFEESDKTKDTVLIQGLARWVSEKNQDDSKRGIRTRQAVMGIRGTDYIVKAQSLFGETEIVVLEGEVNFESLSDNKDQKLLKKNQWGGIGGRYGQSIGNILDLPKSIIKYFNDIIPKT